MNEYRRLWSLMEKKIQVDFIGRLQMQRVIWPVEIQQLRNNIPYILLYVRYCKHMIHFQLIESVFVCVCVFLIFFCISCFYFSFIIVVNCFTLRVCRIGVWWRKTIKTQRKCIAESVCTNTVVPPTLFRCYLPTFKVPLSVVSIPIHIGVRIVGRSNGIECKSPVSFSWAAEGKETHISL